MKDILQPGMHPDADQLSTFVEGAASAHERRELLAHLAECAECRQAVFLMQGQEGAPAPKAKGAKNWTWRWLMPLGLAGALASGLATVAYVRAHHPAGEAAVNNAQGKAPAAPRNEATSRIRTGPAQPSVENPGREHAHTALPGALRGKQKEQSEGAAGAMARASTPPAEANGAAQSLGVIGGLSAAAAPPSPQAAVIPQAPAEAKNEAPGIFENKAIPALRIEHGSGPDDGTSEVSGLVTDQTGAVVSGATVALRDQAGATRNATSSGDGRFDLANVAPGHYELEVHAKGFQLFRQTMDLKPRDMAMLDTKLTVGAESQTVTVQAQALALQTDSNVVSTISSEQISKVATQNRNFAALASVGLLAELPNHKPATMTVTLGKRVLSLDDAGTVFLSHNGGRKWKKVKARWTGKVAKIELMSGEGLKNKAGTEGAQGFELATEDGVLWVSEDGAHWRAR